MSRESVFDKIGGSTPVNKATALANSGGASYERPTRCRLTFDAPPPMKPVPPDAPNLVGVKFGYLTVIGLVDATGDKRGAWWVVKCVCGKYETRRAKAITNPKNIGDSCQHCGWNIHLKRLDWETQHGLERSYALRDAELAARDAARAEMEGGHE